MNTNPLTRIAAAVFLGATCGLLPGCALAPSSAPTQIEQFESHLQATPGGLLIAESIEAQGGLEKWLDEEVLEFRWIYHMSDRGPKAVVNTLQRVDLHSRIAKHEASDSDIVFGWNGTDAWIHPADASFTPPPRFWALTPFYFVGVPFVFADLDANFELLDAPLPFEPATTK